MWGPNPSSTRRLPTSPFPYSYRDYLTAWFKFMLHHNENMSHSWFVNFDKDFNSDLPLWFIHWWTQFGLVTEIFPESLVGSFQYFTRVCSNLMLMGLNFLLCSISLKNIRFLGSWNGNMIGKVMFSLAASMLSGGISFLTPKQLLTMSPKNSHTQILYWRLRSIPEYPNDSGDERSSKASVTKNPYYPYNQEWFGYDEEDTLDLPEDWLIDTPYFYGLQNGQNAIMFTPGEVSTIVLHCWSTKMMMLLKRRFFMILVTS